MKRAKPASTSDEEERSGLVCDGAPRNGTTPTRLPVPAPGLLCRAEAAYVAFLVRRPRAICGAVLLLTLLCQATLAFTERYTLQNFGLHELLVSGPDADRMDMVNDALRRRDLHRSSVRSRSELSGIVDSVRLYYRWNDGRADDIFTPANLVSMCRVENLVLGRPDYDTFCFDVGWSVPGTFSYVNTTGRRCTFPFTSPTSFFYVDWSVLYPLLLRMPWFWGVSPTLRLIVPPPRTVPPEVLLGVGAVFEPGRHTRRCELLNATYVAARSAQLHELALTLSADDIAYPFHRIGCAHNSLCAVVSRDGTRMLSYATLGGRRDGPAASRARGRSRPPA